MERNKAATHQFSRKYRNINVDNLRVGRGGGGGRNPVSAEDQLARTPNLQLFVPIEMPEAFNYRVWGADFILFPRDPPHLIRFPIFRWPPW